MVKESICQCKRCGFHPWVRKIPWRREWQSTPVFLPGEFHGQRSLSQSFSSVTQSCPTLCDHMDSSLIGLFCPWNSPGRNTGVGCHFLLQGIFPIQSLNLGLPHCRQTRYLLLLLLSCFSRVRLCATHRRQPTRLPIPGVLQARTLEWVAISFSNA